MTGEANNTDEAHMATLLRAGDAAGALAHLRASQVINARMANMGFTALVSAGTPTETAAVEMISLCHAHRLTPTQAMHNNILGVLAKASPPEAVLSWMARMRDSRVPFDVIATNIELKALTALGDFASAMRLLHSMPSADTVSWNTVITACAHAGDADMAEQLLASMLDGGLAADAVSFTAVIQGFARASLPARATRWLHRMLDGGIPPDVIAFNGVLAAYAATGDARGARGVLEAFERRAAEDCPKSRPDVVSYNTVLSACARAGSPRDAEAVFQALAARANLAPDQVSYCTVISAHARAGDVAQAQSWLDRMGEASIVADAVTYNTVCSAHARVGNAAAALATFGVMERAGVAASAATHAIIVNALVQAGACDRAEKLLRRLVARGERLAPPSFNTLISAHAKGGRADRAEALLELMQQARVTPSLVSYNALAAAHAARGAITAVERVLGLAAAQGLQLDGFSFGALLNACAKCGDERRVVGERAHAHVLALLASSVPLNDFLRGACRRAVGDSLFQQLLQQQRGSNGGGVGGGAGASPGGGSFGGGSSFGGGGGACASGSSGKVYLLPERSDELTPSPNSAAVRRTRHTPPSELPWSAGSARTGSGSKPARRGGGGGDDGWSSVSGAAARRGAGWPVKVKSSAASGGIRKARAPTPKLATRPVFTSSSFGALASLMDGSDDDDDGGSDDSNDEDDDEAAAAAAGANGDGATAMEEQQTGAHVEQTPSFSDALADDPLAPLPTARATPRAPPLFAGLPLTRSRSSVAAPGIKLVGMPLTRSKSDRARLLSLAQDILAEANQLSPPSKPQPPPGWAAGAGLRRHSREHSWATREFAAATAAAVHEAPAPLPFTRSAASDLAVHFGSEMVL